MNLPLILILLIGVCTMTHAQETNRLLRIWAYGDAHVGTDARHKRESLAAALRQSEEAFDWDLAIDVGDNSGGQAVPDDAEGRELVRQYSVLKKHRREQIYSVCGNHDRSGLDEPAAWWFQKWIDPLGQHTAHSGVDATKRPYPVSGTWERYSFRVGNLLFLMMSDINEPSQKVGRGPLGGNPGGVVSAETFAWWKQMVADNPDAIIVSVHHYLLKDTTTATGEWEGMVKNQDGRWQSGYHGYKPQGTPQGASYLYWVGSVPDAQAFEKFLAARQPADAPAGSNAIALWLGGHTHPRNPADTHGGKPLIATKWGGALSECVSADQTSRQPESSHDAAEPAVDLHPRSQRSARAMLPAHRRLRPARVLPARRAAAETAATVCLEPTMSDRPNILLIMTDQQRGDCLSAEGHPVLLTPNMDNIAYQGARFRYAYSTCPVCIPARRSFLSGQFPHTHGMVGYQDGVEWDAPVTLPSALAAVGYETALVGRSMHQWPVQKRFGFQTMITHSADYRQFLLRHGPAETTDWFGGGVMHNDWTARPWHLPEPLHMTNWVVTETLRFLRRRDPSAPFFLIVSFLAPHPPLQPPAFYFDRYLRTGVPEAVVGDWADDPPLPADYADMDYVAPTRLHLQGEALRSCRAAYYGLINHVDDQIRRLLNPADGPLVGDNTVVVFTSDHGEMLGDHYLWRKRQPYEPSARVPLLISAPRSFGWPRGTVLDQPVCLEDIMPTLLELAGAPIPSSVEGRSLVPLLRGEKPAWRDCLHLECAPQFHALTDGREKYVWLPASGQEQFFDLQQDPHELRNLAAHTERVAPWRARLIAALKDRPEGFSDGRQLIAGRPYPALLPHARSQ